MINSQSLISFIKKQLGDRRLVIAIQREPYVHTKGPRGIEVQRTVGGAHILLDGILKKVGGLMVAMAAGDADQLVVDRRNRIKVPPGREKYILKRVFLKPEETDGFYYGFANQTLWPLCHAVFVRPVFEPKWWKVYTDVNRIFADAILSELRGQEAVVWINDYHLALVPRLLKKKRPDIRIGTFWHIPWPTYELFRICPWKREILEGLLGSDFIGFHRGYHVENFVDTTLRILDVMADTEPRSITYKNHVTRLANVPAGIDYHEIQERLEKYKDVKRDLIRQDFGIDAKYLVVGVDRIDYTKGIIARLNIIDRFLEKYPKYKGKLVYLSIGAPSRSSIPAYKEYNDRIDTTISKINTKYQAGSWKPIHFVKEILKRDKIFAYYGLADVCMVTSLDDGMNLVAKEFVICADPKRGMLVLSQFTGAAKDLTSALLINPYDADGGADTLLKALTMRPDEKYRRNLEMKEIVRENNIYRWGIEFIKNTTA